MFIKGRKLNSGELGPISSVSSACLAHCVVHLTQNPDQWHSCHGVREPTGKSRSMCLRSGRLPEKMKSTAGSREAESREGYFLRAHLVRAIEGQQPVNRKDP